MAPSRQFVELCALLADVEAPLSIEDAWNELKHNATTDEATDSLMKLAALSVLDIAVINEVPHYKVVASMIDLHNRKNAGYAGLSDDPWRNFRESTAFGVTPYMGVLVRLSDKYQRYMNITRDPTLEKVDESVVDTLMDMACYSLIAVCLYMEELPTAPYTAMAQ